MDIRSSLVIYHRGRRCAGEFATCFADTAVDFLVNYYYKANYRKSWVYNQIFRQDKKSELVPSDRFGHSQRVTGLVVNGDGKPRTPRRTKRTLRAAINNLQGGGQLRDGESLDTLRGMAAFVNMTDRALGQKLIEEINGLNLPD